MIAMTRKPKTFAQAMAAGTVKALVAFAFVGSAFFLMASGVGQEAPAGLDKFQAGQSYPEKLAAKHDCWMGEAPADVEVPGHVVVRYEGDVAASYQGSKAVADALEHIFEGKDNGIAEVTAFCR